MKRLVWGIPLLLAAGCGVASQDGPQTCADGSTCADASTEASAALVDPRSISTPVPERTDTGSTDSAGVSTQLPLDPFTGFLVDAVGIEAVLSMLFDDAILNQLDPSGPRLDDSLTFLERLCREGDSPDFVCRDRFGN